MKNNISNTGFIKEKKINMKKNLSNCSIKFKWSDRIDRKLKKEALKY